MSVNISRGTSNEVIEEIRKTLRTYENDHSGARIDIYRQCSFSVRVRIIDPGFVGQSRSQRHDLVWKYLDPLTEDVQSDISTLLLLSPEETATSFGNMEFEEPVPSDL